MSRYRKLSFLFGLYYKTLETVATKLEDETRSQPKAGARVFWKVVWRETMVSKLDIRTNDLTENDYCLAQRRLTLVGCRKRSVSCSVSTGFSLVEASSTEDTASMRTANTSR